MAGVDAAVAVGFKEPTVVYSVGEILITLDTTTDPLTIRKNNEYTLVLNNIPTPE